jgi:N-acetylglucosamine kinase-like BadF-type ATPase
VKSDIFFDFRNIMKQWGMRMKQYYLSVDAGGSKVHLLLFDSEFHRIDFEVASSANPTLVSKEQIRANMTEAFSTASGEAAV